MKARRSQESRSAETREKLIQAAVSRIASDGYAATTTNDIADAAGVSRGALQHQFHSRYDLIAAVVDRVMSDITDSLRPDELTLLPLQKRVERILESYWRVFNSETYRAALNIYLSTVSDPALKERVELHLKAIHEQGDAAWKQIFGDVRLDEQALLALRRLLVAAARGYAILGFGESGSHWQADLESLIGLVVARLGDRERADQHRKA